MRKQLVFTMMLLAGAVGGLMLPASARVELQQTQTIRTGGQVVDQNGEPLIGVTVKVKGSTDGIVTDLDGNFQLDVQPNATLVISYVGYKDREVAVRGHATLGSLELEPENQLLEQVVVVGYGTQKKADLTGSVAVVNADELKRVSNSNISTMLEGKVAGVQITSDGQPGADPSVRIRGLGTFNGTAPLYVIDGVPMGTTIRDFSPNDIETIQVLKDASAAAIYGSRAANGVIIITTKNGKKEQPLRVDYKGYFGWDVIRSGVYDVMNADQYSQYLGQACANSNTPLPGGYSLNQETGQYRFMDNTNTDWFNEVFKGGTRQNHNINLSGGGASNTYNIGLDYFKQNGTLVGAGPNYSRFTARVNNTMDTKFVKFRTSIVYSHSNQDGIGIGNGDTYIEGMYGGVVNILKRTSIMQPTIKAYDESTWYLDERVPAARNYKYDAFGYGVYYNDIHGDISASNPLLINNQLTRKTTVDRVLATGSADFDLLKMVGIESQNHKLNYKLNLSYSKTHAYDNTWIGAWIQSNRVYFDKSNENLTEVKRTYADFLSENTLTYDGTFGLHHVNLLGGITYEEENEHRLDAVGKNFPEPYYLQIGNAGTREASSYEAKHSIASFIGRLNYDYDGKYLLSATLRRDGSSRLTKDIRWETFPSISLGWRLDKEKFFPLNRDLVNMFKVRFSYGELGNENIGNYMFYTTYISGYMTYSLANSVVNGSIIEDFVETNLAWEKKSSTNIGVDLAMFRNRLEFTAEYYKNKSTDLLYGVAVPASAGFRNETVTMNSASIENSGFEFSATYRNFDHPLKWQVSANLSTQKNKVTKLDGSNMFRNDGDYITYVGQEVGQFYGYRYKGIIRTQEQLNELNKYAIEHGAQSYQSGAQVGDCYYEDLNGDGQITADDREVLGSGMPNVNFGISGRIEYKGFDLSVSTYGALGFKVADDIYNALNSCYGYDNKDVAMLDANRFSADGTYISDVPRTYITADGQGWTDYFSERKMQNGNYWKIANIEIGYNFPNKWFRGVISSARVYASVQNLCTITKYKGYNVDFAPGTFTPGYNFCSYPSARSFMTGVSFSF